MKNPFQLGIIAVILLGNSWITNAQWRTIWRDDFDGPRGSQPSGSNWIVDRGTSYPRGPANWGTGEVQFYTNKQDNLMLDGNGNLMIIPRRNNFGGWTSARIETTRTDFRPPGGGSLIIEARIQAPNVGGNKAVGYWAAFWAIGAPFRGNYYNWPSVGEIDIMENVNGLNSNSGAVHCGSAPGGPCNEFTGRNRETPCPGSSCQSGFHTYRFIWDDRQKEFTWYIDGQQYHKVSRNDIGGNAWDQMTGHGYFLLLNVAIGGAFPNAKYSQGNTPISDTEPGHPMVVDYVGVYTS